MRTSIIKSKLARGERTLVTTLHLTDPSIYELTSLLGFDGIWMDLEHHAISAERAAELMRASRVGSTDVLARPAKGEFMRMGRLLEAGASGILYPRCSSAAEAAEVVRWAKFHPLGCRGFDGGNPDMPYCSMSMEEYIRVANEETFVAIQIEDEEGLADAEAIASIDGVDLLFFGPSDYSVLCGIPGQSDHPKIQSAIDRVARAARRAGKSWGTTTPSAECASVLVEKGARLLACGADILMVKEGLEALQREFAPLGFTFENRLTARRRP